MSARSPSVETIRTALHPLDLAPGARCWNEDELADLLPPSPIEAAVLVGLVARTDGWRVLFTRRTDALRHHAGQVSFPGGRCDPCDATPIDTALREAHEEVGIEPAQVEVLGCLPDYITGTGFRVTPVVGNRCP